METVKNVIFDLGGIFLDLDYRKTRDAFIDLGITNFDEFYTQHHANPLFEQLETGKITPSAFFATFKQLSNGKDITEPQIETAWSAMLLGFTPERIEWLRKIRLSYRTFLFSNTNALHYDSILSLYKRDIGKEDFLDLFEKAYFSHEMGLRKPYLESFEFILKEQGLIASETLFIDDTEKNVTAAREAGLQAILLVSPRTVLDLPL